MIALTPTDFDFIIAAWQNHLDQEGTASMGQSSVWLEGYLVGRAYGGELSISTENYQRLKHELMQCKPSSLRKG